MTEGPECVGCGYCCKNSICRTGAMIYGHYKEPCPALIPTGRGYECRLYLSDPDRFGAFLGIGEGCCFPVNPLRRCLLDTGQVIRADGTDTGSRQVPSDDQPRISTREQS